MQAILTAFAVLGTITLVLVIGAFLTNKKPIEEKDVLDDNYNETTEYWDDIKIVPSDKQTEPKIFEIL